MNRHAAFQSQEAHWHPSSHSSALHSSQHAAAALRWFETLRSVDEWGLTVDEQCELLGGVAKRTFQTWKKKALAQEDVELGRDVMERFSLLIGIYKAYKLLAPTSHPELAGQWFQSPNDHPMFHGQSVKQYLLSHGTMNALYSVRRYLDAARG